VIFFGKISDTNEIVNFLEAQEKLIQWLSNNRVSIQNIRNHHDGIVIKIHVQYREILYLPARPRPHFISPTLSSLLGENNIILSLRTDRKIFPPNEEIDIQSLTSTREELVSYRRSWDKEIETILNHKDSYLYVRIQDFDFNEVQCISRQWIELHRQLSHEQFLFCLEGEHLCFMYNTAVSTIIIFHKDLCKGFFLRPNTHLFTVYRLLLIFCANEEKALNLLKNKEHSYHTKEMLGSVSRIEEIKNSKLTQAIANRDFSALELPRNPSSQFHNARYC